MRYTMLAIGMLTTALFGCSSVNPTGQEEKGTQISQNKQSQVPAPAPRFWQKRHTIAPLTQNQRSPGGPLRHTVARGTPPSPSQMVGFRPQVSGAYKKTSRPVITIGRQAVAQAPQQARPITPIQPVTPRRNVITIGRSATAPRVATAPATPKTSKPRSLILPVSATEAQPVTPVIKTRKTSAPAPAVRMVNSKRILLNYEVKDIGPSGLSGISLWYTKNGRDWKKDTNAVRKGPPYVIDVDAEGVYGFTLIARSGLGLGKKPPKPGDSPQVWVEVDLSKPLVNLQDVKQGLGKAAREITIEWNASDKHLTRRPITISYATNESGPWTPIAANLANNGSYLWKMPKNAPFQFWLKVEAIDQVGNIGTATTPGPIQIDVKEPMVNILGVESAEN